MKYNIRYFTPPNYYLLLNIMPRLLFLILFLVAGCSSSRSEAVSLNDLFEKEVKVKTVTSKIKSRDVVSPVICSAVIDNYLILGAYMNEKNLYVYDLNTGKLVNELIHVGRGPNEMFSLNDICSKNGQLFLFGNNKEWVTLDNGILTNKPYLSGVELKTNPLDSYFRIIPIKDEKYIASGCFSESDKQFVLLDKEFNIIAKFDNYPTTKIPFSAQDLGMGFQGKLVSCGNGGYFAYVSNLGCVLKFFKFKDNEVVKTTEYAYEIPNFKSMSVPDISLYTVVQNSNTSRGALSVCSSNDKYYVLYCDKPLSDKLSESNLVYVFDNEGLPVEKLVLDRSVTSIIYCQVLDKLYALGVENEDDCIFDII